MLLALVLAATQPWLEMQAGPMALHESGRRGTGSGPMVRMNVGTALTDRIGAELWLQGSLEGAPRTAPGDTAIVGGGVAGRLLVARFGEKLSLFTHAGAGFLAADRVGGPAAFGGLSLAFQPFVKRFTVGIEADALAGRQSFGFALLPSLRCLL